MCLVVLGSVHGLPQRRAVYMEDCLYVCLSILSFGTGSTSPRYQMVFANFYVEIITPSTLRDI
jgi:hypothetical protein